MQVSPRAATATARAYPAAIPAQDAPPAVRDAELMSLARDGDTSAFEVLFMKYGAQVVDLVSHFAGSRARAEELAQDAFLRVFRERGRYPTRTRFAAHVFRVAAELCLSEARQSGAVVGESAERAGDLPARLRSAVDRLPTNQRVAFLLSRLDGLSHADIAETLEASQFTLKSLIYTATQTVRANLQDLLPS